NVRPSSERSNSPLQVDDIGLSCVCLLILTACFRLSFYFKDPSVEDAGEVAWVDPSTGQTYMVNRKTGNSYQMSNRSNDTNDLDFNSEDERGKQRSYVDTSRLRKRWRDGCCGDEEEVPGWIQEALNVSVGIKSTYLLKAHHLELRAGRTPRLA